MLHLAWYSDGNAMAAKQTLSERAWLHTVSRGISERCGGQQIFLTQKNFFLHSQLFSQYL